jgi:MoaA/NifB/PqqE/SkfB family radical SAM enzyme
MMNREVCLFNTSVGKRVVWEVTKKCNYKCSHCCNNSNPDYKEPLDKSDLLRILDEMDQEGVESIYFSGGEPLLREDMLDILEYASGKHFKELSMASNGSTISKDVSKRIAGIGLTNVMVSLDGHDEETHNRMRGVDTAYKDAVSGIRNLLESGQSVRIGTVISAFNADHLKDIADMAVSLGAKQVYFNWLIKAGRASDNESLALPIEEYYRICPAVQNIGEEYKGLIGVGLHRGFPIERDFPDCSGGEKIFHVTHEGFLSPCSWVFKMDKIYSTGRTLREASFSDLAKGDEINKFRKMVKDRSSVYGPGCPAFCMSENRDFFTMDPADKSLWKGEANGQD